MELCGVLMHHIKTLAIAFVGLGVLASDLQAGRAEHPGVEPKADELLRKMSTTLGGMRAFRFDADQATDAVARRGEKLPLVARSAVAVERPDKFRSERIGPASDLVFTYDRGRIMLYARRLNMVGVGHVPDTLDRAIEFARGELALDAPAADLLHDDAYASLMAGVVSGRYLGADGIRGRRCHHLGYRGVDTDWQIWIEDGPRPLPCRYLITRKKAPASPTYAVEFSNWKVAPKLADGAFVFIPPSDAVKIDFFGAIASKHATK